MKKMILIIMTVCMIATLGIATAQADWFVATVKATGVGSGTYYINLSDNASTPAFTSRWFVLDPAYAKEHLATALTALATGIKVDVFFSGTGDPPNYATVQSLYIDNG